MHLFLFSYHYLFIIFFLLGIFFFVLIKREIERKKATIILLVLCFFLSQPKILPASVYTYISIRRYTNTRVPFFLLILCLVLAKFGADIILHPDSSIPTYKNRVCIYTSIHTKKKSSVVYIREHCMILYSVVYILSSRLYVQ
jgi:hypothetical protein